MSYRQDSLPQGLRDRVRWVFGVLDLVARLSVVKWEPLLGCCVVSDRVEPCLLPASVRVETL